MGNDDDMLSKDMDVVDHSFVGSRKLVLHMGKLNIKVNMFVQIETVFQISS